MSDEAHRLLVVAVDAAATNDTEVARSARAMDDGLDAVPSTTSRAG